MTTPVAVNGYGVAVGSAPNVGNVPYITTVAPATTNIVGPNGPFKIGQMWINSSANTVYVLTSLASSAGSVTATWTSV